MGYDHQSIQREREIYLNTNRAGGGQSITGRRGDSESRFCPKSSFRSMRMQGEEAISSSLTFKKKPPKAATDK